MNTTMDTLLISIQSTTSSATQSISKLISSLKKLQKELDNTVNKSKGLSSLKNIDKLTKSYGVGKKMKKNETPSLVASNIQDTNKIKSLKSEVLVLNKEMSNLRTSINNIGVDMSSFKIDEKFRSAQKETQKYKNELNEMVVINKKLKDNVPIYDVSLRQSKLNQEKNIDKLTGATKIQLSTESPFKSIVTDIMALNSTVPSLEKQLEKLKINLTDGSWTKTNVLSKMNSETTKYKNKLGQVVTVVQKVKDGIKSYNVSLRTTANTTNDFNKKIKSMGDLLNKGSVKFAAMVTGALAGAKKMISYVDQASAETEAMNLFMVSLGENAQKGTEWIEKFSNALYLDPVNVMQYMGSFNSLVEGLGVGSNNAYLMSKNLTQLVYDLSSFKNISIESSYEKLMSGISGELEPLRNVGVAMSEATLQTLAYQLGIDKLVREMTEAEKAQLRYIQIMRSSSEWQTDMGRTLISPANAIRVMRQQFTLLGRAIGKVFIPIIMEAMPYVIALTQLLTNLANKLAKALGYKITDIDYSNLGEISSGIKDIGNSAEDTKKKLNSMLAPFDDLNVVQNKNKDNSGLGAFGGDLGVDLPEYDALAKLDERFAKNVGKAKKNLQKLIPVLATIGGILTTLKIGKSVLSFFGALESGNIISGTKKLSGLLGVSTGGLAMIFASITANAIGLAIELPKLSKAFDDVVIHGKSIKSVSNEFSTLDKSILGFLGSNSIGQLGLLTGGLIKSVEALNSNATESVDVLEVYGDEISKLSKKQLTPLVTQFENLNKKIVNFDLANKIISNEDIINVKNNLDNITNTIANQLDTNKNKQLSNIKTLEGTLGLDKVNELLTQTQTYYDTQYEIVSTNSNRITEILQNASNNNRQLTSDEMKEINRLRTEMYEKGVKEATQNSDEYYAIMGRLKNNLGKLSIEQASEYIQNAKKTKDESIKAAEEQYDTILAQAGKMLNTKTISKSQYDEIIDAAKKTRDSTIDDANNQYNEIYNVTTTKMGASGRYIDQETGKIKSRWSMFTDEIGRTWDKAWVGIGNRLDLIGNKIKNSFIKIKNEILNQLNKLKSSFENFSAKIRLPSIYWDTNDTFRIKGIAKKALEFLDLPTSIPKLKVKWYEQGGYPTSGDLFFANENGIPEMVGRIGNRTAVANNDQIATSLTNSLTSALEQYDFGGGKSPTIIYLGPKKIYEGYGDYVENENDRYGTNVIRV